MSRPRGAFCLILHAHLPFVRHPEHPRFLEESWFYEAVVECYLPLLEIAQGWRRGGIRDAMTLSLSPTLCSMLTDPLLVSRCTRRIERLAGLAEKEILRTALTPAMQRVAVFLHDRLRRLQSLWHEVDRDLPRAFSDLQTDGTIELITTGATHGLVPLMSGRRGAITGQIETAMRGHQGWFGRRSTGFWLPECAYSPEVEPVLKNAGVRWTVVDSHGLHFGAPSPPSGTFAPVESPSGIVFFGRDHDSALQVWSRDAGYPGDENYRDFYRDIGFDADIEHVEPCLPCPDVRGFTGIKYHAIGRENGIHRIYDPEAAEAKAAEHAAHFVRSRVIQINQTSKQMSDPPVVVSPYDAELFGHWWFEGPLFLDHVVRLAQTESEFQITTPSRFLEQLPDIERCQPAASTWGEGGYLRKWINPSTEWMIRHLNVAQIRMEELAQRQPQSDSERSLLNDAARELLLAQSSDWPFIISSGTSVEYAESRFRAHIARFNEIHELIAKGQTTGQPTDGESEGSQPIFPAIDFSTWGQSGNGPVV